MSERVRIAVHGAAGRMGKRLVALASEDPGLQVVAAWDRADHPQLHQDAGGIAGAAAIGVPLSALAPCELDAVIDFSTAHAVDAVLDACQEHRWPLVLATTALTPAQQEKASEASHSVPVCWAPNMSLAVNLTMKLAEQAARALRHVASGVDVEILERHHRFKEDAPSGTALKFGELIAAVMGQTESRHGRQGVVGQRSGDEIGYHAIRAGDDPGQHTILFGMMGETVELTVCASNRDCYATGALAAAKFLAGKPPGLYSMYDVLGI